MNGVRPGQIWEEIKPKNGRQKRHVKVTGTGCGDVYCLLFDTRGEPSGPPRIMMREGWEDRWRLLSDPITLEDTP